MEGQQQQQQTSLVGDAAASAMDAACPVVSISLLAPPAPTSPPAAVLSCSRQFACSHPGCSKSYSKVGKLNRHLATHSALRFHVCPHSGCSRSYHRAEHLHRHLLSHTNTRDHPCTHPGCGSAFFTASHLARHLKSHSASYPCTAADCQLVFSKHSKLRSHLHSAHGAVSPPLSCPHSSAASPCLLTFPSRSLLNRHIRQHHSASVYLCTLCSPPASFPSHLAWRRHQRDHRNDLQPCSTCSALVRRRRAAEHQRCHDAPTFRCAQAECGKQFVTGSALRAHGRVAHGQGEGEEGGGEAEEAAPLRPWLCEQCGKAFGFKHVMLRHVQRLHRSRGEADEEALAATSKKRRTVKERAFGRASQPAVGSHRGEQPDAQEQEEDADQDGRRDADAAAAVYMADGGKQDGIAVM